MMTARHVDRAMPETLSFKKNAVDGNRSQTNGHFALPDRVPPELTRA